jgi:putative transposase
LISDSTLMPLPQRQRLHHEIPPWVQSGACYFITVNTTPRGANQLATLAVAPLLLGSVARYHALGTWWVHLFLAMPDHVHALLGVAPDCALVHTMRAWKSWQTKSLGITWQAGFFDHRLRSDESFEEKAHYIRQNPVRAGLVRSAEDWPHVWSPKF